MKKTTRIMAITLALLFVFQVMVMPMTSQASARWNESNWMEKKMNVIRNRPLNQIAIPGTHDSATYYLNKNSWDQIDNGFTNAIKLTQWPVLKDIIYNFSRTQERNIYDQLVEGNRYLDIRFKRDSAGSVRGYHGMYGEDLVQIVNQIARFVGERPNEILIVDLQNLHNLNDTDVMVLETALSFTLGRKMAYRDQVSMSSTVGEILDKRRPVFVLTDDSRLLKRTIFHNRSQSIVSNWKNTSDINVLTNHLNSDLRNKVNNKLYVAQMVLSPNMDEILGRVKESAKWIWVPFWGQAQFAKTLTDLASQSIYKMTVPNNGRLQQWVGSHNANIYMRDFYNRDFIIETINRNR